jgi:putative nucleotidyltransferase with HDIG domain
MIRWLRNFPMTLRTLVMTVVAVVLVLAFFAFLGSDALDSSTARIQEMELRYAGLTAESIDSQLENYFRVLAYQADVLSERGVDPDSAAEALSHLRETGLFPGGTFFLDANGKVAAAEPALSLDAVERVRNSSAVQRALQSGTSQVGEFLSGPEGNPQALILEPVRNTQGGIGGWLGGSADLGALPLRDLAGFLAEGSGGTAMVIDTEGNSLALGPDDLLTVQPAPYYDTLAPFLGEQSPAIVSLDKNRIQSRDNIVVAFAALRNAPWTVVIEQPEAEVFSLLRTLRWQFVYFGALIMLVAVVSAWVFEEVILDPIRELLRATRRLAAGDMTTPIRTAGRDETAELSKEFETMRLRMADWSGALSAAVERQTHRLSTLYAIDRVASKTLALEEVLVVSLEQVVNLMTMDAGGILLGDAESLGLKVHHALPPELADAMGKVDSRTSAIGAAAVQKKVVVLATSDLPSADPLGEGFRRSGFRTVATTPLIAKDQALGVVVLCTRAQRSFDKDDLDMLETIGQQIGGAVHNAQLFESEQRRREQAEGLYELGAEIISLTTLQDTARAICTRIAKSTNAHSVNINLIDPGGQVGLRLTADAKGATSPEPPPRPHGLTMRVFLDGKSLIVTEPDAEGMLITSHNIAAGVQATIGMPLRTGGRVIGALFVRYGQPRTFSAEEIRGLTTFANTTAVALERARLLEETERRLGEVAALYDLSSVMRGTMKLQEMLPSLLHQALHMARADAASISLVEGNEIVCRAAEGLAVEVIDRRIPIGEGLIGGVAAGGEVRQTPFLPRDPLIVPPIGSVAVVRGVGCTLCLPLRSGDEVVGVLLLLSYSRSMFNDGEVRLLTAAADIAGGSIQRANLFEQLEHRVHELGSLYEFGQAVSTSLRSEDVIRLVVDTVPSAVHAEAVWVFLWNEEEERLVLQKAGKAADAAHGETKYRAGEGLVGWAFIEGRGAIVADVNSDPRWKQEPEQEMAALGFRVRDALAVPMIHGKKVLGVLLAINRKQGRRFSETDQSLFEALAGQTAIAIENAKLFEDVRDISVATISSLANAIDARDPYTRGHSEEVTRIVVLLARELGWQGADLEMIEFAALLHDVGKIAVPDDILRKPVKLVDDEWNIVYLHPYHSAQILRPVEPLHKIIPWIYHHHERWDGTGYPDRLKGEAIPEGARIIAVVDAFNAITTNRPYHKALSEKEALAEIARNAGKQFDPAMVKAFLKIMKSGRQDDVSKNGYPAARESGVE